MIYPARTAALAAILALATALGSPLTAQDKPARPSIYDKDADAIALVENALATARRDNKRVLAMFGGDWCGWCHKLHGLFESDREIRSTLRAEYELVMIDTKAKGFEELKKRWESPITGYPYLVVLAADGQVVRNQETGSLEEGKVHSPEKVLGFLTEHKAPPVDARDVLAAALAEAKRSNRKVFVHIGAPWCGWCHKLEAFLARPDVAPRIAKDLIDVKIDQDRMTNGKDVAAELREGRGGGIPWSVFMTADGTQVITSDAKGPGKGNIGFPTKPEEIDHLMAMLEAVRTNMTDEDMVAIRKAVTPAKGGN